MKRHINIATIKNAASKAVAVLAVIASTISFTACVQDSVVDEPLTESIGFNATTSVSTKGSVISGTSITPTYKEIAIYSWMGTTSFMSDTRYTYSNGVWNYKNSTDKKYWPNDESSKINFFAYAPSTLPSEVVSKSISSDAASITVTVPTDNDAQTDILVAQTKNASKSDRDGDVTSNTSATQVPLVFKHALSQVNFILKNTNPIIKVVVKGVEIQHVNSTATIDFGGNAATAEGTFTNYPATLNDGITTDTLTVAAGAIAATTGNNHLILAPQTTATTAWDRKNPSAEGSRIALTCEAWDVQSGIKLFDGTSYVGASFNWLPGRSYTYTLAFNTLGYDDNGKLVLDIIYFDPTVLDWDQIEENTKTSYTFNVTAPSSFTYKGGSNTISVTSYSTSVLGTTSSTSAQPWTATFSTDGGATWTSQKPSWLTMTTSGNGGTSAESFNATISAQSAKAVNAHKLALKGASEVSNFDLSTNGGASLRNTANCYIINAPGSYTFPLVYGNAIKNGAANTSAYTSSFSTDSTLTSFVNHLGRAITDPYIYNNAGCTPASATLVWSDVNKLVENVALSGDGHSITFTVPGGNIDEGNAVIAVRDANGEIMWSWHIWATDYVLGSNTQATTNLDGVVNDFMPINLGWCYGDGAKEYDGRDCLVKLTQTASQKDTTFEIAQNAYGEYNNSHSCFYEWGRKDPSLGAQNSGSNNYRTQYYDDKDLKWQWAGKDSLVSIASSIKNPNVFFHHAVGSDDQWHEGGWCKTRYVNMWNSNTNMSLRSNNAAVKTIYDPSPAGFCLPSSNAWSAFTTDGEIQRSAAGINVNGSFAKGYYFYNQPNKTGKTSFYPASGIIAYSTGKLDLVGNSGEYWSSDAFDGNAQWGRRLLFRNGNCGPRHGNFTNYCFSVRPVKEK